MRTTVVFLISLLFAFALSCPNDCSGHGTCYLFWCRCNQDWTGSDCSVQTIVPQNGQLYTGIINANQWSYYRYPLMDMNQALEVRMNETNADPNVDCDVYIRLDNYPTLRRYTFSDVSTHQNVSIMIEASQPRGNYFIGIFGFQKCEYILEVIQRSPCPNACSSHGACDITSHICTCDVGFGGPDCSVFNKSISANEQVSGRVEIATWNYFYFDFPASSGVITVKMDADADADIYVKKSEFPTTFVWDYANATSTSSESSITIPNAGAGRYYIGIHGYVAANYNLILTETHQTCQSECSLHGSCLNDVCSCNPGFSGVMCENMTNALPIAQPISGFLTAGVWNYYFFESNTESNLIFTLNSTTAGGDADLFILKGSYPNFTHYDYVNTSFLSVSTLTVDQPGMQTWYIGVIGWNNCSYTLTVTTSNNCNCAHGTCNPDGVCLCETGWAGEFCDYVATALTKNSVVSAQIKRGDWLYFYFTDQLHHLSVVMKETSTTGMVWTYLKADSFPTLRWNDDADQSTSTDVHMVQTQVTQGTTQGKQYWIGFYGSPFIDIGTTIDFKFEIWYF